MLDHVPGNIEEVHSSEVKSLGCEVLGAAAKLQAPLTAPNFHKVFLILQRQNYENAAFCS